MDLDAYRSALEAEMASEIAENAHRKQNKTPRKLKSDGKAIMGLLIADPEHVGGRFIYAISGIMGSDVLLKVGDDIRISYEPDNEHMLLADASLATEYQIGGPIIRGIVMDVNKHSIKVASDAFATFHGRVWLVKVPVNTPFQLMFDALATAEKSESYLVRLAQGDQNVSVEALEDADLRIYSKDLNDLQVRAVRFAVGSQVSVIHGPPGTGKTSTLIEVARQLLARNERILICGASNMAVDNLTERLIPFLSQAGDLVRLANPARVREPLRRFCADNLASEEDDELKRLSKRIRGELGLSNKARLRRTRAGMLTGRQLQKQYQCRRNEVVPELLLKARIVTATLHQGGARDIKTAMNQFEGPGPLFQTVVIDEVSQALFGQCLVPLVMVPQASRLIVAGDSKQLPPTIKVSDDEVHRVLERTLFDVLVDSYGDEIKHFIPIQYRMCNEIMAFPSSAMYNGDLKAHASVASRRLHELHGVTRTKSTESPILWIDTSGGRCPETKEFSSTKNLGEAKIVAAQVETLQRAGVRTSDIGVITPYKAQAAVLKSLLHPDVEVSTVDGFQGREKEVIILTLVRSNEERRVGFLADERRMNVAITRPRRYLCVVGDMETVGEEGFLHRWVQWIRANAEVISAPSLPASLHGDITGLMKALQLS